MALSDDRRRALEEAKVDGFGEPASLPVTYLIDCEGLVRHAFTPHEGLLTKAKLDAALAAVGA